MSRFVVARRQLLNHRDLAMTDHSRPGNDPVCRVTDPRRTTPVSDIGNGRTVNFEEIPHVGRGRPTRCGSDRWRQHDRGAGDRRRCPVHGHPGRQHRQCRAADDQARRRVLGAEPLLDPERVHADLRGLPAARRTACRPARAAPLFMAGIGLFATASLVCGVSQSEGELLVARGLQGLGGAMVSPAASRSS